MPNPFILHEIKGKPRRRSGGRPAWWGRRTGRWRGPCTCAPTPASAWCAAGRSSPPGTAVPCFSTAWRRPDCCPPSGYRVQPAGRATAYAPDGQQPPMPSWQNSPPPHTCPASDGYIPSWRMHAHGRNVLSLRYIKNRPDSLKIRGCRESTVQR